MHAGASKPSCVRETCSALVIVTENRTRTQAACSAMPHAGWRAPRCRRRAPPAVRPPAPCVHGAGPAAGSQAAGVRAEADYCSGARCKVLLGAATLLVAFWQPAPVRGCVHKQACCAVLRCTDRVPAAHLRLHPPSPAQCTCQRSVSAWQSSNETPTCASISPAQLSRRCSRVAGWPASATTCAPGSPPLPQRRAGTQGR